MAAWLQCDRCQVLIQDEFKFLIHKANHDNEGNDDITTDKCTVPLFEINSRMHGINQLLPEHCSKLYLPRIQLSPLEHCVQKYEVKFLQPIVLLNRLEATSSTSVQEKPRENASSTNSKACLLCHKLGCSKTHSLMEYKEGVGIVFTCFRCSSQFPKSGLLKSHLKECRSNYDADEEQVLPVPIHINNDKETSQDQKEEGKVQIIGSNIGDTSSLISKRLQGLPLPNDLAITVGKEEKGDVTPKVTNVSVTGEEPFVTCQRIPVIQTPDVIFLPPTARVQPRLQNLDQAGTTEAGSQPQQDVSHVMADHALRTHTPLQIAEEILPPSTHIAHTNPQCSNNPIELQSPDEPLFSPETCLRCYFCQISFPNSETLGDHLDNHCVPTRQMLNQIQNTDTARNPIMDSIVDGILASRLPLHLTTFQSALDSSALFLAPQHTTPPQASVTTPIVLPSNYDQLHLGSYRPSSGLSPMPFGGCVLQSQYHAHEIRQHYPNFIQPLQEQYRPSSDQSQCVHHPLQSSHSNNINIGGMTSMPVRVQQLQYQDGQFQVVSTGPPNESLNQSLPLPQVSSNADSTWEDFLRTLLNQAVPHDGTTQYQSNTQRQQAPPPSRVTVGYAQIPNDTQRSSCQMNFFCNICNATFLEHSEFQVHLSQGHRMEKLRMRLLERQGAQQTESQHVHHGPGPNAVPCRRCAKVFSDTATMKTHLAQCELRHKCPKCPKDFKNEKSLKVHITMVHAERKFVCHLCPQKFRRMGGLKRHQQRQCNENTEADPKRDTSSPREILGV